MSNKLFNLFLRIRKAFSLFVTGLASTNPVAQRMNANLTSTILIHSTMHRVTMHKLSDYDSSLLSAMDATTLEDLDYTIIV